MTKHFEDKTVKELLKNLYKQYGIPEDAGLSRHQVKIEFTPKFYAFIPNFQARKEVVLKHDAHHLLTGTAFNLFGETEIAMWEIAAGCYRHWFAFLINNTAIPLGLIANLPRVFKAFVSGRRCNGLYDNRYTEEQFMNMNANELYNNIGLDKAPNQTTTSNFSDYFAFAFWIMVCALVNLLVLLFIPLLFLYNIYVFLIVRPQFS